MPRRVKVGKRNERKNGVTKLRVSVPINAPKAADIKTAVTTAEGGGVQFDILQNVRQLITAAPINDGGDRIHHRTQTTSLPSIQRTETIETIHHGRRSIGGEMEVQS